MSPVGHRLSAWWEAGKGRLKGLAIRHCKISSNTASTERSLLSNLAAHLKARIDFGHTSCFDVYHNVLSRLAELDLNVAKGAQIRSRVQ